MYRFNPTEDDFSFLDGAIDLSKEHTTNGGNYRYEEDFSVRISLATKAPDESIKVIKMDADNMPISQQQYTLETLPKSFKLEPKAQHVIVEKYSPLADFDDEKFRHEVIDLFQSHNADFDSVWNFTCFKAREDGILEKVNVDFDWR